MILRIRTASVLAILGWLVSATTAGAAEMTTYEAHLANAAASQKTT
jgi:hypothetical protein